MAKAKMDRAAEAQIDLETAKGDLARLLAGEGDALSSAEDYGAWQRRVAAARSEVSRRAKLATRAVQTAKVEAEAAARAAQERLEAEFDKAAANAAVKIAENLQRLADIARETAALVAASEEQRLAAQAGRAKDLPPLVSAETRARGAGGHPIEIVSEVFEEHWVYVDSGHRLTPDLARRVNPTPGGSEGRLPSLGKGMTDKAFSPVIKQSFKKTIFHPAIPAPPSHSLVTSMLIPAAVAGGQPGWSPCADHPAAVRAALDALAKPIERETKTEMIPVSSTEEAAA